jgi:hypothetical protein
VPLGAKKSAHVGKSGESAAALLQLPHLDAEALKRLARKKVKTLPGKWRQPAGSAGGGAPSSATCACMA